MMRIVACYIVKNEAKRLARSLSSLETQVDEIIVVDTGSTDSTKNIAQSYGAKVYEFVWRDDFSAARNFALDRVRSDWVVFLDGDEYFSFQTKGNLRRVIQEAEYAGTDLLLIPWHNIDEETGEVLLDSYAPRIFRYRPKFRFEGRIHEELRDSGCAITNVGMTSSQELVLVHTGYSAKFSKKKAERNAKLLLNELKNSKNPGNLYMYLAEAYDGMEDSANAIKYAELDIAQGRRNVVYASRSWHILLRQFSLEPAYSKERQKFAAKAVSTFPELPEFHAEYAECLAFALDFPGAVREADAAVQAFHANNLGLEPAMFDNKMLSILQQRRDIWGQIAVRLSSLHVTSCLIVKDGEADMKDWLDNTARFSDETVVMDTGSKDRTREIAVSAGCRVYNIPWNNNFAQARNASLSRATGDWVSVLDVDEVFECPEQVRPFLAWLDVQHPEMDAVIVPRVNVDADDGNRESGRDAVLRLFRNRRGLRYEKNVHEELHKEDGGLPRIFREMQKLVVLHKGYSSGRVMAKAQRNLELLQEDIARHGEGPQHYRYLADCYSALGEWDKTFFYAKQAIAAPLQSLVSDCSMQHLLFVAMRKLDCSFAEQEVFARSMCEKFPDEPEFFGILGIVLAEQGQDAEACSCLEESLRLSENASATRAPSDFANVIGLVCAWLAIVYARMGRGDESEKCLKRAMHYSPREDDVLNAAREIKSSLSAEEFTKWLGTWLFPGKEEIIFLARWAERNGHLDLLANWREMLRSEYGHSLPRTELYEAATQGKEEELESQVALGMERDIHFLIMALFRLEREGNAGWQDLARQCCNLLPGTARDAWMAYAGKQEELTEEGFWALWPFARRFGDASQMERFALLSFSLGGDAWRTAARELMEDGAWEAAFSLHCRIPEDSPRADGEFWHDVGVCLWHLGEAAAEECFARARALGCKAGDMAAYEAWRKEDGLR